MAGERKIVAENLRRVLLREYLMRETHRAGFGGLDIQRTPMGTRITLIAERPGIVIGRQGAAIKTLTDNVARDFSFDNPQIEVQEVERPALNAQIMAEKLANALERGWHFRRAGHSTVRRIMEAGGKGCHVIIAGKLTGRRHRTVPFGAGHVKYCGHPRDLWMRRGFAIARMKPGTIGVTVEIMDPQARLPDEVRITPPEPAAPPEAAGEVAAPPERVDEAEAPPPAPSVPAEAEGEAGKPEAEAVQKGTSATRTLKKEGRKPQEPGEEAAEDDARKGEGTAGEQDRQEDR